MARKWKERLKPEKKKKKRKSKALKVLNDIKWAK